MVAKRVHTPCPLSARTTTEFSELTVMISGLVQRQALLTALLTGLLRQTGSERPAKATATAARKPALLTDLLSKSAASLITAPPIHLPVSQPKKAPLTGLLSKSAVPVTHLSSEHISAAPLTALLSKSAVPVPVSQPASLLNKTNRPLSDPQPPPPVRPRMARIRSQVKAYKAKVKATQQASLKSTLTACLLIDTVMRTVGLDPTHNKVCAGNLVHPLSKVVTSCADSAATTDFLAGQHSREALNKVELSHPLPIATAGHDTLVTHRGDLTLGNGLPMKGALILPDSSITLTSIPQRTQLGWSFLAKGLYAFFISPAKQLYTYILHDGLYVPASAPVTPPVAYIARTRAATRVPLGVPLHVKPVHIPAPVPDVPWIMPIAEHSAFPRPDPNPVSVARGFPSPAPNPDTVIVADAYGNNTVTNPTSNSSDPPVKSKNLPKAKPSILGVLRSILSDPKTYGAATLLADGLFNSGLGMYSLFAVLLPLLAIQLTKAPAIKSQDSPRQSENQRL